MGIICDCNKAPAEENLELLSPVKMTGNKSFLRPKKNTEHKLRVKMNPMTFKMSEFIQTNLEETKSEHSFHDASPNGEVQIDEKFADSANKTIKKEISLKHIRGVRQVDNIKEIYEWEKELGAGAFGTVHEATHKQMGTKIAMKVMHKKKVHSMDSVFATLMRQELEAL